MKLFETVVPDCPSPGCVHQWRGGCPFSQLLANTRASLLEATSTGAIAMRSMRSRHDIVVNSNGSVSLVPVIGRTARQTTIEYKYYHDGLS